MWKCALALLLSPMAVLADGPAYSLTLPAGWTHQVHDNIESYRSPDARQALTVAVYELTSAADDRRRAELAMKSAELRRQGEKADRERVALSKIVQERANDALILRYSGVDGRRRFMNVTVTSQRWLQNFYYEVLDVAAEEFGRAVERVFGELRATSISHDGGQLEEAAEGVRQLHLTRRPALGLEDGR